MTQNIYDNPEFFAAYATLPRSISGPDAAGEWPALRAMLPDLAGRDVVDLGCGYGWFCRFAREQGAKSVLGIDASQKMLERAAAMTADPAISYRRADLEALSLPGASCDIAYSSLAFHYIAGLDGLLGAVHAGLRPGGHLVLSIEHPIFTAPSHADWIEGPAGKRVWPLDDYSREGPRTTNWLADGVIKQHRTIASYLNGLIGAGFAIRHVEEWAPTDADLVAHPDWASERSRPPFLLVAAQR